MGDSDIRRRVEDLVADIPPGRVMTYGDVAACAGYPGAARRVGTIAHEANSDLPWHRVVASQGRLVTTSFSNWQAAALAREGVRLRQDRVLHFDQVRWFPDLVATPEVSYSPAEVAAMLDISKSTILRRIGDGTIAVIRRGTYFRVRESEVVRIGDLLMAEEAALPLDQFDATLRDTTVSALR